MWWTVVSGRNGENAVFTGIAKSMKEVLRLKYLCVCTGDDWIEVYQHKNLWEV